MIKLIKESIKSNNEGLKEFKLILEGKSEKHLSLMDNKSFIEGIEKEVEIMEDKKHNLNVKLEEALQLEGKKNIKIEGYKGTWYTIEEGYHLGNKVYLLESETYGDETACIIVNNQGRVILDDVWNGFEDLEELENFRME